MRSAAPFGTVRQPIIECLLIADDLTGACDALVHFSARGYVASVPLSLRQGLPDARFIAVSTDSRDLAEPALREIMARGELTALARSAKILFKKIDSVLRGSAGIEIRLAMEHFGCDAAIVTPAYPALNRIVHQGHLRVMSDPAFDPIHVARWLSRQGLECCAAAHSSGVTDALASGERIIAADAMCDEDLDEVVRCGRASGLRLLWAGSAGLAGAIARTIPAGERIAKTPVRRLEGVLFCVGSDHPVTLAQRASLMASRPAVLLRASQTAPEVIATALRYGEHVILEIPRGQVLPTHLTYLLQGSPASALLITGGDTASLICRSVDAGRIDVVSEILPGLPRGILRGGTLDGFNLVTKSGGFGDPHALIQVADFFTCLKQ